MPLTAWLNIAASSGLTTGCTAKIREWRQNGSIARQITVRPPIDRYCLGLPDPARSPRPAATMIAAVRFGIVFCWEQSGVQDQGVACGAQPLSCRYGKIERFRIAVRILLHCTCKIGRIV